jgi:hypothetical protein
MRIQVPSREFEIVWGMPAAAGRQLSYVEVVTVNEMRKRRSHHHLPITRSSHSINAKGASLSLSDSCICSAHLGHGLTGQLVPAAAQLLVEQVFGTAKEYASRKSRITPPPLSPHGDVLTRCCPDQYTCQQLSQLLLSALLAFMCLQVPLHSLQLRQACRQCSSLLRHAQSFACYACMLAVCSYAGNVLICWQCAHMLADTTASIQA